ncbi:transcription elongation factor A protein 2-like isoform X2 [Rana temporaria]|uniref:transcription elongation factor A protein 2-like isoform X2 n=1 Tax=Rana temporaria TaxID=8407 RepID=UPI001AADC571|nr:transcription elongation factor A protein 2-like isoform X2 [Rana temporaria]
MGSEEDLRKIGRRLEKRISDQNMDRILDLLKELQRFPVTVPLLRITKIGVTVNKLKKHNKDHHIVELAKVIIRDWKKLLESSYKSNGTSVPVVGQFLDKTEPPRHPSSAHKKPHPTNESASSDVPRSPSLQSPVKEPKQKKEYSKLNSPSLTEQATTKETKLKREYPELNSPSMTQHATAKETKLKRSHSTDVQSSSHTSKKSERRLSLNASPSSASSKSFTTHKEERRTSVSSPTTNVRNGSSKPSTHTKEERSSDALGSSPTCGSPPSSVLLHPSYVTGNSVRDKCVEMVAAALRTDGDYIEYEANCDRLAWEIEEFVYREIKATDMKYRNRIRSRISNLKDPKNPSLRRNVLCGTVSTQNIATMTAEAMASEELKELRNTLTQVAIREHQMAKTGGTQTDLLQCDKCKKKNCSYNQVQTRSADEPMTTFVLCNECGHRWKFC